MAPAPSNPRFASPLRQGSKSTDEQLKSVNLAESFTAYVQSQNESPRRWFGYRIVQRNTKNLPGRNTCVSKR